MIEAFAVVLLMKKAGKVAEMAGLNAKKMKLLVAGGWFGGEILGFVFGLLVLRGGFPIIPMLVGAVLGSGVAFSILNAKSDRAMARLGSAV
jgi:hypothetical protein